MVTSQCYHVIEWEESKLNESIHLPWLANHARWISRLSCWACDLRGPIEIVNSPAPSPTVIMSLRYDVICIKIESKKNNDSMFRRGVGPVDLSSCNWQAQPGRIRLRSLSHSGPLVHGSIRSAAYEASCCFMPNIHLTSYSLCSPV